MSLLDDAIKEHLDLKRRRGADPVEVERAEREALGPVRRAPEVSASATGGVPQLDQNGLADDHSGEEDWPQEPYADASEHDLLEPGHLDDEPFHEAEPVRRPSRFARLFGRSEPEPEHDDEAEAEAEESSVTRVRRVEAAPESPIAAPAAGTAPSPALEPADPTPALEPARPEPSAEERSPRSVDGSPNRSVPPPPPHPAGRGSSPGGGETVEYDVQRGHEPGPAAEAEDVLEETPEFLQDTPEHDRLWFEQRPPRDFDFDR